jgi:hypothetical protein
MAELSKDKDAVALLLLIIDLVMRGITKGFLSVLSKYSGSDLRSPLNAGDSYNGGHYLSGVGEAFH